MNAPRSTLAKALLIVTLTGVPILVAAHPDWVAWFQEQFPAGAAPDLTSAAERGFVKRFNSSADGKRLLFVAHSGVGLDPQIGILEASQPELWMPIDFGGESISTATLSADGLSALIGTSDGRLAWITVGTSTEAMVNRPSPPAAITATAVAPDQRQIAAATDDGRVFLGNRSNDTWTLLMPRREPSVADLRFSCDGSCLVAGRTDGSVIAWNCATGQMLQKIAAHRGPAMAVVMTPDGEQIISAGEDGAVRIWATATGSLIRQAGNAVSPVLSLAVSADGTALAWGTIEGTVHLSSPGGTVPERELGALRAPVWHLEYSADGRVLAVAGCEGVIRRFDVATGAERPSLEVAPAARN